MERDNIPIYAQCHRCNIKTFCQEVWVVDDEGKNKRYFCNVCFNVLNQYTFNEQRAKELRDEYIKNGGKIWDQEDKAGYKAWTQEDIDARPEPRGFSRA